MALGGAGQLFGDLVERLVPGNRREGDSADAFLADPAQWPRQPRRMMLAFGVTGNLRTHHAPGIGLRRGSAHPPDATAVDALDFERARARTIMRTDAGDDVERQSQAPLCLLGQNITNRL